MMGWIITGLLALAAVLGGILYIALRAARERARGLQELRDRVGEQAKDLTDRNPDDVAAETRCLGNMHIAYVDGMPVTGPCTCPDDESLSTP